MSVHIQIPDPWVQENNSFTATVRFRSGGAASVPSTNVKYRVDNLSTTKELKDWTSVTPASEVSIAITSTMNKIQSNVNNREKIQLTVSADRGETTATYNSVVWNVENVFGYKANT